MRLEPLLSVKRDSCTCTPSPKMSNGSGWKRTGVRFETTTSFTLTGIEIFYPARMTAPCLNVNTRDIGSDSVICRQPTRLSAFCVDRSTKPLHKFATFTSIGFSSLTIHSVSHYTR